MRRILNDGDPKRVMIPQVPNLPVSLAKPFNLLDIVDLKQFTVLCLKNKSDENSPVRVRVDATPCVPFGECGEEEGRALGGFVVGW